MSKLLFFLESETIAESRRQHAFRPCLSHDDHLIQVADAAMHGDHEVYVASIAEYAPDVRVTRLRDIDTFQCDNSDSSATNHAFDGVVIAHPDKHWRTFFPGARTIGYFPALYFVEMPDHFLNGRLYYLLRALQHHVDFFLFQNERQADFLYTLARALAGIDTRPFSYVMPYGIRQAHQAPDLSARKRIRSDLGIEDTDVVLIHGGGAWRWTDFDRFLSEYCQFAVEHPKCKIKLIIPGLSQSHNKDHNAYIAAIDDRLTEYKRLLRSAKSSSWKILYERDWETASNRLPEYYLASDIGVSVNPQSFEFFLSHRVRVVSYVAHGLGLLLSRGDTFSESKELAPISYVANTSRENCYYDTLLQIETGARRDRNFFIEHGSSAVRYLKNRDVKLKALNNILSSKLGKSFSDCPLNRVYHDEKVEIVRKAFSGVFDQLLTQP